MQDTPVWMSYKDPSLADQARDEQGEVARRAENAVVEGIYEERGGARAAVDETWEAVFPPFGLVFISTTSLSPCSISPYTV